MIDIWLPSTENKPSYEDLDFEREVLGKKHDGLPSEPPCGVDRSNYPTVLPQFERRECQWYHNVNSLYEPIE
jgi:hypothetical protein